MWILLFYSFLDSHREVKWLNQDTQGVSASGGIQALAVCSEVSRLNHFVVPEGWVPERFLFTIAPEFSEHWSQNDSLYSVEAASWLEFCSTVGHTATGVAPLRTVTTSDGFQEERNGDGGENLLKSEGWDYSVGLPCTLSLQKWWTVEVDIQFSSVIQLCPTLCDRRDCSTPGLPDVIMSKSTKHWK